MSDDLDNGLTYMVDRQSNNSVLITVQEFNPPT